MTERNKGIGSMVKGDGLFSQAQDRGMKPSDETIKKTKQPVADEGMDVTDRPNVPKPRIDELATSPESRIINTAPVRKIKPKELDSRMLKLDNVPSLFKAYDFPDIYVRPLEWAELELIAQAEKTGRVEFLIQAIDATLSVDVEILTIPDFYFILYWQRLKSYPSTPYYMPWTCDQLHPNTFLSSYDDPQRIKRHQEFPNGEHICAHDNTSPLREKDLRIIYLDDIGYMEGTELDACLDWPRVSLLPEIDALQQISVLDAQILDLSALLENLQAAEERSETENERVRYTMREMLLLEKRKTEIQRRWSEDNGTLTPLQQMSAPAVQWVRGGSTLKEKNALLRSQPNLSMYECAIAAERQWKYGVVEYVNVKCERCGAGRHFKVNVSASTFLP